MDISADQVRVALFAVIAFVVSVSVHEFGHAFVADRLGDRIPRLQGRLTLSPLAHIDPIGTLAMPLFGVLSGLPLIAWGKPVQTNPANYTKRFSMTTGHMLVAAAGPFMNLVLAVIVSVVIVVLGKAGVLSPVAAGRDDPVPPGPQHRAAVLQPDPARAARRRGGAGRPAAARRCSRIVELNRKYGMLVLLVLFFSPGAGPAHAAGLPPRGRLDRPGSIGMVPA